MLILAKNPTFKWPIKYDMPSDGGRREVVSFDVVFKRISKEKLDQLLKAGKDLEFCKEVIADWENVKDGEGRDVKFSPSILEEVFNSNLMLGKVIATTYLDIYAAAVVKN